MTDELSIGNSFRTYEEQDKILVGLSGGVDSAVCVKILQDQGFAVHGVFVRFSAEHDATISEAQAVADKLGIPLIIEDCSEQFEKLVINTFCSAYCSGKTPSPCVICNPLVKFKTLATVADRLGIHLISTGHYARIDEKDSIYYVQKAASVQRDQSYMLYRLDQSILSRLCLPLGDFEKSDIRDMAAQMGLPCADTPDSQEICFIKGIDYAEYIEKRGLACKGGKFIGPTGEDMGPHKGIIHYTIGQRKGLNISYKEPLFVKKIMENGDIQLATAEQDIYTTVTINDIIKTSGGSFAIGEQYMAKVRSRAKPATCKVVGHGANGTSMTLEFSETQRGIAPGQSLVLYSDDLIAGGGIIDSAD